MLPAEEIYSLIALCAFYARHFGQASKAFIKLKALPLAEHVKRDMAKLALAIFSRYTPNDPAARQESCYNCSAPVREWDARCSDCGTMFAPCVASGRSILDPSQAASCRVCKHRFYESEMRGRRNCPLCHSPLQVGGQATEVR